MESNGRPSRRKLASPSVDDVVQPEKFEFVPGPDSRMLRIIYRGFWDEEVIRRYRAKLRQRAVDAGGTTDVRKVLLDLRDCTIQSRPVIEDMEDILKSYIAQIESFGMILPTSPLLHVQMKHLMHGYNVTYFDTNEAAEAWLAAD